MSEGEFKKRGERLIMNEPKEPQSDGGPDPYFYGHRDGIKEFLKIVHEARKKILESAFKNCGMPHLLPDGVTLVMNTEYPELKLGALVREILTWFGDVKT